MATAEQHDIYGLTHTTGWLVADPLALEHRTNLRRIARLEARLGA
jgi:hypothetical protein